MGKVNRRRHGAYESPEASHRQCTVYYTIPDGSGQHKQICRKSFTDIFSLSHRKVQELIKRKKRGKVSFTGGRGKNSKRIKFTADLKQQIKNHINSFPRQSNHYSRSKSIREFLSPDLNLNRIFFAFKQKFPNTIATYKRYSSIFHTDF